MIDRPVVSFLNVQHASLSRYGHRMLARLAIGKILFSSSYLRDAMSSTVFETNDVLQGLCLKLLTIHLDLQRNLG